MRKKAGRIIWKLTFAATLAIFLFSAFSLLRIYLDYKAGVDEYAEIADTAVHMREEAARKEREAGGQEADTEAVVRASVEEAEGPASVLDQESPESPADAAMPDPRIERRELVAPPLDVDFQVLKDQNPDVRGWIYIEALDISYPIVQGETNEAYLHTTYDGNDNSAGSIFVDCGNSGDFTDGNTIIYGHNMKNQTMFGKLKFLDTQERYRDSIYFWVLTPEKAMRFQIISAFYTEDASEVYTLFARCEEEFAVYMTTCLAMNILPLTQPQPDQVGRLVTLSTCAAANSTQRFVVQGMCVQETDRE